MLGEHDAGRDTPRATLLSEDERIAVVHRFGILDTPPEVSFDRITALAARLLAVPIALVSIVDRDRIWFKSRHGLDIDQVDRKLGLCALALESNRPFIVPDLHADATYRNGALARHPYGMRFYAGAPLVTAEGVRLGTICVMDRKPRQMSPDEIRVLRELAAMTIDHIELRFSTRRALEQANDALKEKARALELAELMKQETDHRIMNSLQLVASLLMLQSRSVKSDEAAYQLKSAASRVQAVAGVHRHFYLDPSIDRVSCLDYLRQLCGGLSEMLRLEHLDVIGDDFTVPAKTIVSVGLIVNELVTNAAKYGGGQVQVELEAQGDTGFVLSVQDSGDGFSTEDRSQQNKGLGMRVVRVLAQQIGGRLTVGQAPEGSGARVSVQVPSIG